MRRQKTLITCIGNILQCAGFADKRATVTRSKAIEPPESLRRIVTIVNAPNHTVDGQRSEGEYFAWASDFKCRTSAQMFSISIRAGKIPDPETAKITGKSWTQNSLGGGA